jgi:transposase
MIPSAKDDVANDVNNDTWLDDKPYPQKAATIGGLPPKPHSSGGKERLGAISKMGNRYIRRLLYLGAMGVISTRKRTTPGEDWLGEMLGKKPLKVVVIALANRMARQIWAMLRTGEAWRAA